ncbi:MAG TPA: DUF5666 domain-containing protein [Acidimicrobiales bacterium]|nr:DUF5666 domain-containing protein [Acidimicrobiales bacterium]
MTDPDTTLHPDRSGPAADQPTQEIVRPRAATGGPTATATDGASWEAAAADDDAWPQRGPRKGIRMSVPTVVMLALLVAAGGVWGGAALQRSQGSSSGSSSLSSLASLFRGARGGATGTGGAAGTGLGAGAFGAAATGTVTEVSGSTLYVTNSSGDLVKVTVSPTTPVDRNAKSSLGALQVGDTVVVRGTKQGNGSVSATSVSATASGVTAGGGFGGFGG